MLGTRKLRGKSPIGSRVTDGRLLFSTLRYILRQLALAHLCATLSRGFGCRQGDSLRNQHESQCPATAEIGGENAVPGARGLAMRHRGHPKPHSERAQPMNIVLRSHPRHRPLPLPRPKRRRRAAAAYQAFPVQTLDIRGCSQQGSEQKRRGKRRSGLNTVRLAASPAPFGLGEKRRCRCAMASIGNAEGLFWSAPLLGQTTRMGLHSGFDGP